MSGEKSEKATPKKLKDSRKEGRVARTQELGAWASILAVALSIQTMTEIGMGKVQALLTSTLRMIVSPDPHDMLQLLRDGSGLALMLSLAMGAGVMVIGVASAVAQGGLFFATKSMQAQVVAAQPARGHQADLRPARPLGGREDAAQERARRVLRAGARSSG